MYRNGCGTRVPDELRLHNVPITTAFVPFPVPVFPELPNATFAPIRYAAPVLLVDTLPVSGKAAELPYTPLPPFALKVQFAALPVPPASSSPWPVFVEKTQLLKAIVEPPVSFAPSPPFPLKVLPVSVPVPPLNSRPFPVLLESWLSVRLAVPPTDRPSPRVFRTMLLARVAAAMLPMPTPYAVPPPAYSTTPYVIVTLVE
jgi:hypothetical protein